MIDLALEGKMLGAAFVAAAVSALTGSAWLGLGACGRGTFLLIRKRSNKLRMPQYV